ncbi:MAG: hypothetical protein PGN08_15700 [Sphingomonas taxi]
MARDLQADHDQLRAIMRRFAIAMDRGAEAFATLHRERVLFSQLFRAHMIEEEAFARSILGDDAARIAWSLEFHALLRDYSAHISAWTPARVKIEWSAYRAAVMALQARLNARMDWEERELHPRLPPRPVAA